MAISFVANSATASTGANPSVTYPASIVNDDFLIIVTAGSATTTTPTGWTQIAAQGAGQFITAFYKFYNSNTDTSPIALTNAGTSTVATMLAYRGVGLHDVVGSFSTTTGTSLATSSQTTLLNNDRVISIFANVNGGARTWTAPGSTTTLVNSATTSAVCGLLVVDEAKATAGATSTRTATISNSSALASVSISIREPQTLYWRGSSGTWSSTSKTNWAITSGGTGSIAVPNRLDTVVFDNNSNTTTGAFTITASGAIVGSVTFGSGASALDGAMTLAMGTSTIEVAGNWSNPASNFAYSGTGTITFSGLTAYTITTNGISMVSDITFNGVGGSWQLQDALTTSSARTITLTNGTLDLNSRNISTGAFSSSGTNTRTLAFGTGQINLTGINTQVLGGTTTTGLTVTGTPVFNITGSGTAGQSRTLTWGVAGGSASMAASFNITSGADLVSFAAGSYAIDLTFTSFTGTSTIALNISGNLTLASGMSAPSSASTITFTSTSGTKTITTNGVAIDHSVTFDGVGGTWQLQDALTVSTSRTVTLTNGVLNLNNNDVTCWYFTSSAANTRSILFGTGQFYITGGAASGTQSVWRVDTGVGLTVTGTTPGVNSYPTVNLVFAGSTGTRQIVHTNASGTYSNLINVKISAGSDIVTTGGTPMFKNVDFTGYSGASQFFGVIAGNCTIPSTMTHSTTGSLLFFNDAGETQTLITNGVQLDAPIQVGQRSTITNISGDGSTVTVTFGSSTNFYYPVGSTINISGVTPTGYNGSYVVTSATLTSITYASTTTGAMTVAGQLATTGHTLSLTDALTVGSTRTLTWVSGNILMNNNNITCGLFSSNIPCVRSITPGTGLFYITGNNGSVCNLNTNTGVTQNGDLNFYFTYAGSTGTRTVNGWGSAITNTNWYITAGTDTFSVTGNRLYNNMDFTGFGGIVSFAGTGPSNIYGNFTAPSVTGASIVSAGGFGINFNGSGDINLTTNGVTFDIPLLFQRGSTTTTTLVGNLTIGSTRTFTLNTGKFLAGTYDVSAGQVNAGGTGNRTLNMGTGTWTLTGSGGVWSTAPATNLTLVPANIVLQDTSTTARTFNGGGGVIFKDIIFSGNNVCTTSFPYASTYGVWKSTKTCAFTIVLPANSTSTLDDWQISGTPGNLVTIQSGTLSAGNDTRLLKAGGIVNVDYLSLQYCKPSTSGAAIWYAGANSVDNGNNLSSNPALGWFFTAGPSPVNNGEFMTMFI